MDRAIQTSVPVTADEEVAKVSIHKPGARAALKTSNLDTNAPLFVPCQAIMNDQVDCLLTALHSHINPPAPAVDSCQSLMYDQIGTLLTSLCHAGSLLPPGLEDYCMSAPGPFGDAMGQPGKKQLDSGTHRSRRGKNGTQQGGTEAAKTSEHKRIDTMKAQLQALQLEDPATVFIARGINKLGFSSAEMLRKYFSRYGKVKAIHVSHSRVKSMRQMDGDQGAADIHWRSRAGPLGFVVMRFAKDAAQILADGHQHDVNGVVVRLQPFHRQASVKENSSGSGEEGELESKVH